MKVNWDAPVDLPKTSEVAIKLLLFMPRDRYIEPMGAYSALADQFELDSRQRRAQRRTREEPAWHNRVQTARELLSKLGYLDPSRHGLWGLTDDGKRAAERVRNGGSLEDPGNVQHLADLGIDVPEGL